DQGAMGSHSRPSPTDQGFTPRRTPTRRGSTLFGGHSVDPLDRCPMERTAAPVWQPEYVLAAAQTVGRDWGAAQEESGAQIKACAYIAISENTKSASLTYLRI